MSANLFYISSIFLSPNFKYIEIEEKKNEHMGFVEFWILIFFLMLLQKKEKKREREKEISDEKRQVEIGEDI